MNGPAPESRPPRLTRFLLRHLLDEYQIDELDELFVRRMQRDGRRAARRTYRLELWWGVVARITGSSNSTGKRSGGTRQRADQHRFLPAFGQDLLYAFKSLRKSPGFSVVIVATLAVGIAGNVAMFGVVDAVLLKALPFPESDRLVLARTTVDGQLAWDASSEDYYDYRDQVDAFAGLGAFRTALTEVTLSGVDLPLSVTTTMVSVNLFQTLGAVPEVGRLFVDEDAELADPGDTTVPRSVLISHRLWRQAFGGDPSVVGGTISLNAWPAIVVGVMPAGFFFLQEVDVWYPLQPGGRYTGSRSYHTWTLVGRLTHGTTLEEAQSQVDVVSARLQAAYPDSNTDKGLNVSPLQSSLVESYDEMLLTLMATIGLVLLIACLNVAGLLVARGAGRAEELSVKAAMGASAGRLIRQLLCESLLLVGAAGILGTLLAVGLQQVALEILSLEYVGVTELGLSGTMLTFALLLSVGTILASGLIPAWVGSRANPAKGLTSHPGPTQTGGRIGIRGGLVVVQVACSLLLLIGSGLLVKSFVRLVEVDPGFQPDGLFTARVSIPFTRYLMPQTRLRFLADFVEGVREIPGVQAVGAAHLLPMTDIVSQPITTYDPENPPVGLGEQVITEHRQVLPGFFEAMGITQLAGRDFTDQDCENREPVIIINQTMAQGLFGEENPIGRSVSVDLGMRQEASLATVIGVVGNVQMLALDQERERQMYSPAGFFNVAGGWSIAARTHGDPADFTDPIRQILRSIDPDVPLIHVSTMNEALARAVATPRVLMTSLSLFATLALGLTILGLYAMLAFYVARRVREIGIRMAVGAAPRRIIALVLKRGMILVATGLALGLGAATILTRFLQAHLYRVEATDPTTFGVVCLGLVSVAFLACLLPARRAARGDPVGALRSE